MILSRIKNVLNNYKFMFMNNHKNFSEIKYMMIKKSLFDQNNNDEILKSKKIIKIGKMYQLQKINNDNEIDNIKYFCKEFYNKLK